MNENIEYSMTDVINTQELCKQLHKVEIERQIQMIHQKMDLCDDIHMREHLAKRLKRLRKELE